MARSRSTLHPNHLDEFQRWAIADGWTVERALGGYEVLRLRKGRTLAIYYKKDLPTEHLTAFGEGLKLFNRFMKERRP